MMTKATGSPVIVRHLCTNVWTETSAKERQTKLFELSPRPRQLCGFLEFFLSFCQVFLRKTEKISDSPYSSQISLVDMLAWS
jgi:hypothetical protein